MFKNLRQKFTYVRIMALGFAAIILIGAILLSLPIASRSGRATPFINSVFTSASATCVTGLSVVDTSAHWSLFGQIVILFLIQTGGLGFMTFITMFSIFMKKRVSPHERRIMMQSAGTLRVSGASSLIKKIIFGTLTFEAIGAIALSFRFCPKLGPLKGIWYAIFHSVSAFCNAGFDLMGSIGSSSFEKYRNDLLINITLICLIILGGLGFLVWSDTIKCKFKFKQFQLHTKLVVVITFILILVGTVAFMITERHTAFSKMNNGEMFLSALFQSVTTRTAGFFTVQQDMLSDSGSIISMILMLIGGSSGSTAGGIKTTTIAIFIISTFYASRNCDDTVVFKRRIEPTAVRQAHTIVAVYLIMVFLSVIFICGIEPFPMKKIFYEVVSAIGTVGLSMNLTPLLSTASKVIIIFLMYAGRIGGLSLVLVIAEKRDKIPLERPTENIMIG